jgi:predicted nucleotidyltransferase
MIGQIGIGGDENYLSCYAAMTGKEMEAMLADIDFFGEKVVMQFLHESDCECDLCKNKIGELVYRGKKYNRIYKNTENRFSIENENDADLMIKCIDIKAKCNMNTREQYIPILRKFVAEHGVEYGIMRIGIFGSVARGEQTDTSDVDIYYEGSALGLKSLTGLPQALSEYLDAPVDVVREHDGLNSSFRNRIMKEVIYV